MTRVTVHNPSLGTSRQLFKTTNNDNIPSRVEGYLSRVRVKSVKHYKKRNVMLATYLHPITGVEGILEVVKE